jgi:hypothetical protein
MGRLKGVVARLPAGRGQGPAVGKLLHKKWNQRLRTEAGEPEVVGFSARSSGTGIAVAGDRSTAVRGTSISDEVVTMKRLLGLGFLILLVSLPARAQIGGDVFGVSSINSGGSLNGASSLGEVAFASLPSPVELHYQNSTAHGSASDFVPSTFVPYEQALARGQAATAPGNKPKPVAQVAEEYRAVKRAAAKLAIGQDSSGRIVKEVQ